MSDPALLETRLKQVLEAIERIERRFLEIETADDFLDDDSGLDMLDSISMMLIAIGENFKKINRQTEKKLLVQYPQIHWSGVKGVRDVLSHDYFDVDEEEVFCICNTDLPPLRPIQRNNHPKGKGAG